MLVWILAFASLMVGCITDPADSVKNLGYLYSHGDPKTRAGIQYNGLEVLEVDSGKCATIGCAKDSTEFKAILKLYFVEDSDLKNNLEDKVWARCFKAERFRFHIRNDMTSVPIVFDEGNQCLNVAQPKQDTVITASGSKALVDRVPTPCLPYLTEAQFKAN